MLDLILILIVLLVVVGGGKLREAGSDLGAAVKGVRRAVRGLRAAPPLPPPAAPDAEFPEVLAARREPPRG